MHQKTRSKVIEAFFIGDKLWKLFLDCGHTVERQVIWATRKDREEIIKDYHVNCKMCKIKREIDEKARSIK